MPNGLYLGGFEDRDDVISSFQMSDKELDDFDVIIADYEQDGYEGRAFVLLRERATGDFYEVDGSHCSCYGLEGQFDPELCDLDGLRHRAEHGRITDDDRDNAEIKEAIMGLSKPVKWKTTNRWTRRAAMMKVLN